MDDIKTNNQNQSFVPPEPDNQETTPPPAKPFSQKVLGFLGFFLEILQVLIIVGVLSYVIRMFIIQPFYILGSSMEPTLYEKEILMIDEISYRFRSPKRGEIVVIDPPRDTRDYIKRIIGLP
ncbi:MAG TPA: signal peptidase I [Candidatus Wirthbacteria bacterium]|nr:signal peptidase I [Candidatus Wirthbacteria bacterium]